MSAVGISIRVYRTLSSILLTGPGTECGRQTNLTNEQTQIQSHRLVEDPV